MVCKGFGPLDDWQGLADLGRIRCFILLLILQCLPMLLELLSDRVPLHLRDGQLFGNNVPTQWRLSNGIETWHQRRMVESEWLHPLEHSDSGRWSFQSGADNLFQTLLIKFGKVIHRGNSFIVKLYPCCVWDCHLVGSFGEGSGLGLHIVQNIIEKHQGDIQVTSQPGATVFTVKLPISFSPWFGFLLPDQSSVGQ